MQSLVPRNSPSRHCRALWTVAIVLVAIAPMVCHGRIMRGTIKTGDSWKFLTRFVFQPTTNSTHSSFEFTFKFHRKNKLVLLAYFDQESTTCTKYSACPKWEDVYSRDNSCQFKDWASRTKGNAYDIWAMYDLAKREQAAHYYNTTDISEKELDNFVWRETSRKLTFKSSRNRWFYFALANCRPGTKDVVIDKNKGLANTPSPSADEDPMDIDPDTGIVMCKAGEFCQGPLDVEYKLTMMNNEGNPLQDHFSADEFGILESTIVFMVLYTLLVIVATYSLLQLKRKRQLHHTVKIFFSSICFQTISLYIKLGYWENVKLGTDPQNNNLLVQTKRAYECFDLFANFSMMLVVVLLAKGWTVVRRKISAMGRVRFAVYMTTYMFLAISAMAYGWSLEPGLVEYKYDTFAGELYVGARAVAAIWFTYAVFTTIRNYPSKRGFYRYFWFGYVLWILSVPIVAAIANVASIWAREYIVVITESVFNFLGHTVLLALLWPSHYNKQFPFHAKTFHMEGGKLPTPSRKGTQVLFNKSGATMSSAGRERTHVSGGSVFADPMERAKELANTMRYKLMQIQDYSDDLVETLNTYESVADEEGEDLDPDGEGTGDDARRALEREFEMVQQGGAER
jgi:hypothetical protein